MSPERRADDVETGAEMHAGDLGTFVVGGAEEKVQLDCIRHGACTRGVCSRADHEVFGNPCADHLEWCVWLVEVGSERDVVQDRADEQQLGVGSPAGGLQERGAEMEGPIAVREQPRGHVSGSQVDSGGGHSRVGNLEHQTAPAFVATPVSTS